MKLKIIFMALLSVVTFGCGEQQEGPGVDTSNTVILWQGPLQDVPEIIGNSKTDFLDEFNTTMACLNTLGITKPDYPALVVVEDNFTCGDFKDVSACYYLNTIYIATAGRVLLGFSHEVIHWATDSGVNDHGSIYFTQCEDRYRNTR
jgi:hypothetical protein